MIKTLTLNPAIDKAVTIERFCVDQVNRIASVRLDAGGKGINVARMLHRLGAPTLAVAPVAGGSGRFLDLRLTEEGIPHEFLEVPGETRTNLKVVDPVLGTHTDINEPGPTLDPADLDQVGHRLLDDLVPGDWVVFSGSVPAGVPKELYGRWIAVAHAKGAQTVLDADGTLLTRGLEGRPHLVKPNLAELEAWAGHPIATPQDLLATVVRMQEAGAQSVAVSLGGEGAWLVTPSGAWFAPGLRVQALSTVGAGDAMVAALTWALCQGLEPAQALAQAVATATAAVVQPGTGGAHPRDIEQFLTRVTVQSHTLPRRNP